MLLSSRTPSVCFCVVTFPNLHESSTLFSLKEIEKTFASSITINTYSIAYIVRERVCK